MSHWFRSFQLFALIPFGAHLFSYQPGTILPDQHTKAELDQATASFYASWKSAYVKPGCSDGEYYVWQGKTDGGGTHSGTISTSESQGYGMLILALMGGQDPGAQTIFNGLFHYARSHAASSSRELMAWNQLRGCINSKDADTATDGDLDIAYALILADRQWGSQGEINYAEEARKTIDAIGRFEIERGRGQILLGDFVSSTPKYRNGMRSSDFMPDHFRSFETLSGDPAWGNVLNANYSNFEAIAAGFSSKTGLVPDFIVGLDSRPQPAPSNYLEGTHDGEYDYNACRVPLRLGMEYVLSGDARALKVLQRINAWIRGTTHGDPSKILDGYTLKGAKGKDADGPSMAFVGPFAVGAMVDASNQAWLDSLWDFMVATPIDSEDYYGNTLKLLSMVVVSGNAWAP